MSWNCRGVENSQTVQKFREIRKRFSPDIIFLSETKNPNEFVLRKCSSLDYPHSSLIPPTGHGACGLALFWKQGIDLVVLSFCKNYIDTEIMYENKRFFATFIYADTDYLVRRQLWNELTTLALSRDSPWFLSGDFNDILNNQEKT